MINRNNFIILDFETGDKVPETAPVIQIAALAVEPKSLQIYPGGIFNGFCCPDNFDDIQDGALGVIKKTREEIKAFPAQKLMWTNFTNWIDGFKISPKDEWDFPIFTGQNILNFDRIIMQRLCKQYKTRYPFHPTVMMDTYQLMFYWFERRMDVRKYNMDYIRTRIDLPDREKSKTGAHDALQDCYDILELFRKFMNISRNVAPKIKFKYEDEA